MRVPDYGEIATFCAIDKWTATRHTNHENYEKVWACPGVPSVVLKTHVSFDRSTAPSPGRWKAILRTQLRCGEDQFWNALSTKRPVERQCPPTVEEAPGPRVPPLIMAVLTRDLHLTADEIAALTTEEAMNRVHTFWSRDR